MVIAIIIISIVLVTGFIMFFIWKFKNDIKSDGAAKGHRCEVRSCEVWVNEKSVKGKYCEFHQKIQEIQRKLYEQDHPLKSKANMYMSSNAKHFTTIEQKNRILKELNKLSKDKGK